MNSRNKVLAVALLAAVGAVASAAEPMPSYSATVDRETGVSSVRVSYADLNLAHAAGVAAFYRRLQGAAVVVCGPAVTRDLERARWQRGCVEQAIAGAVAQVDNARLTARHQQAQGREALASVR